MKTRASHNHDTTPKGPLTDAQWAPLWRKSQEILGEPPVAPDSPYARAARVDADARLQQGHTIEELLDAVSGARLINDRRRARAARQQAHDDDWQARDDDRRLALIRRIAEICFDGQVTIRKGPSTWQVAFGPPGGVETVDDAARTTLREAFHAGLKRAPWDDALRRAPDDAAVRGIRSLRDLVSEQASR